MYFAVRKGLETPLRVHGMATNYFCAYCIILVVLVIGVVGFLTNAMSGSGSFITFIVALVICALCSIVVRIIFTSLSSQRKYSNFKTTVFVISNKDLLHSL